MLENYKATPQDLEAIKEGISYVWEEELDFVFPNKELFRNLTIVSFDSQSIYLWTQHKLADSETIPYDIEFYKSYRLPHSLKIQDTDQRGWRAYLKPDELQKFIPAKLGNFDRLKHPVISGGLLAPFTEIQKTYKDKTYSTRASYLATIVHEFGHVYYNQHRLWWFSNKEENLMYLKKAQELLTGKATDLAFTLQTPVGFRPLGELFAVCAETTAAKIFWPQHFKHLEKTKRTRITKLILDEQKKDLDTQSSVLEEDSHDFADIFSTLLLAKYPQTWPEILLQKNKLA